MRSHFQSDLHFGELVSALLIRLNRFLKIQKIAIDLIDLNRFESIFCDFFRFFQKNQIRHRQKTGEDLDNLPLSYDILCQMVSLLDARV